MAGDDNCYYSGVAHQIGKPAPDSHASQLQMSREIGVYLRNNPSQWGPDVESLVNHRSFVDGPLSMRAYIKAIASRVERDRAWADDDFVVSATAVLYQRVIVILYIGRSIAIHTQASWLRRRGNVTSPVLGYREMVPWH